MKLPEILECTKQRKKETRMKIDKMKEIARQRNHDRQGNEMHKSLTEKFYYDAYTCGK